MVYRRNAPGLYGILTGEPWGMTVDQICRLTDWQIEHLYLNPAKERAEEMRRQAGLPSEGRVKTDSGTEDNYVRKAKFLFGGSEDHWRAQWKKQHPQGDK